MYRRVISRGLGAVLLILMTQLAQAQCSICTRTAQQMGERPASALNVGILYLAFTPMAIACVIGYRWWRSNHSGQ